MYSVDHIYLFCTLVEVPELEDKVFASKIVVLFADLPVLAKYRKNLVNLKWAHTPWNGLILHVFAYRMVFVF